MGVTAAYSKLNAMNSPQNAKGWKSMLASRPSANCLLAAAPIRNFTIARVTISVNRQLAFFALEAFMHGQWPLHLRYLSRP
jgi:hypothetical protein